MWIYSVCYQIFFALYLAACFFRKNFCLSYGNYLISEIFNNECVFAFLLIISLLYILKSLKQLYWDIDLQFLVALQINLKWIYFTRFAIFKWPVMNSTGESLDNNLFCIRFWIIEINGNLWIDINFASGNILVNIYFGSIFT